MSKKKCTPAQKRAFMKYEYKNSPEKLERYMKNHPDVEFSKDMRKYNKGRPTSSKTIIKSLKHIKKNIDDIDEDILEWIENKIDYYENLS